MPGFLLGRSRKIVLGELLSLSRPISESTANGNHQFPGFKVSKSTSVRYVTCLQLIADKALEDLADLK